ncbi:MAG: acylneuraminate cytidylyltransferase family protein [Phycisphaerales bacterium]|nr:acylneuraminate cytidylyltransferase family protein [Phycisphaerales bacterium]
MITGLLTASRPALALILARAGSKGLPGKNTRAIAGNPCFQWSIDHARTASLVGAIAISTDDKAMLAAARKDATLLAIDRPHELAGDTITIDAAARHAIASVERDVPLPARTPIVILYANVPVRPSDLIDRAIRTLIDTSADSVQSYAGVGKFHPWWTARVDPGTARVTPWEGDVLNHNVFRRQDLPPAFIPDGGVLCVTRAALFHQIPGVAPGPHAFFGADRRGVITREGDVLDIDTPTDALVADALLRERAENAHHAHR